MMEEGLHKKKLNSYLGWLKYCSSKMLLQIIEQETGIHFSNFVGEKTSIRKMRNRTVRIVHIEKRPKYFLIQFMYKGKPYYIKSFNKKLLNELDQNNF
jgi:hypothetical protein